MEAVVIWSFVSVVVVVVAFHRLRCVAPHTRRCSFSSRSAVAFVGSMDGSGTMDDGRMGRVVWGDGPKGAGWKGA